MPLGGKGLGAVVQQWGPTSRPFGKENLAAPLICLACGEPSASHLCPGHICPLGCWDVGTSQSRSNKHGAGITRGGSSPPPPGDPPAVLPSRRRTDRQTGRVAALLWSNSSPGKQAGCLPARACKCERGKGAIFKEEPLLSQTAEKGSYGPHYQPPPAHRTTVRGEEMPRRSPRVYRSRCDNRYQLINTSEHRQPGPAARSRAGSRGFILGLCVNKSQIPMQSYRKNMLQASGFGATQMKPAATISLLQPQPLTCSLWQVAVPAESAALNVYFSGNKRYLQWEICSEQSSNEAASRHGRTPQ